jgi:hypothetical protein
MTRDGLAHDSDKTVSFEKYEEIRSRAEMCVKCLLSDYSNGAGLSPESEHSGDVNNALNKARIDLENTLGVRYVAVLEKSYPDIYREMKLLCNPQPVPDAVDYARVVQSLLEKLCERQEDFGKDDSGAKQSAMNNIKAIISDVPHPIEIVDDVFVKNAVKGGHTTVGGALLGLFYLADNKLLKQIVSEPIELVTNTARLIEIRGHNRTATDEERRELKTLRRFLMELIKYFMILED